MGAAFLMRLRIMEDLEEEERFQLYSGDCFGEWALMYNKPRCASAFVLEDCDLMSIEKEQFDLFFTKSFMKAELERKLFFRSKFKCVSNTFAFEEIFKKIVPIVNIIYLC